MDFFDLVITGTSQSVQAAISNGADVNPRDNDGWTALMGSQHPEVITALLAAGANAKAKDSEGKTAFDYAQTRAKLKGTDALRKLEEASQ
jgi:ankyrin repeat protein